MKQNQALTHVDLSRNGLGDYGQVSALLLLEALVGKERLAIFDFSANGLVGPDGTDVVIIVCWEMSRHVHYSPFLFNIS